ncbi:Mucin-19 [Mizuhopecten yessoensis]|uniref:Mucin-19 n=1 Tax=Mizuhopecten yessoensis TaxID=6573 RepID=A0A210PKW3_MIZYE|nr:Mucin-19 [Mizuhopecten yessoensis]
MYRPWYTAKGQTLFLLILLLSIICGFEATLTDAIFHGQTEVLVTPGLVRKEGLTLDKCASACVAEKTIKCQYFKFINNTKTCYLSETDHPSTKHVINQLTKPGGIKPTVTSSSSRKFDGLEQSIDRLKNVQEKVENLEETDGEKASELKALKKQSVKQVKAIVNLDSRLSSLHTQVSDVGNDVLDLEKSQRTIAKNVQLVRSSTGNLGLNIKRLTHLAGDLQSDVEDVKIFNSSILRQLTKVSHNTMDLDRKLNRLSTYLHDKRIFNPDDILHTQLRISKDMSTMARSHKSFWHQLRGLEHTVDMLTSTLGRESKGTGEVNRAVLNLQSSIHNIKIAMAKLSDPMSFQNRRWQGDVSSIKHILVKLAGTNSRLDDEMTGNRREVATVIKDLTNVQMAVQSLKSNIDGVRTNNAELVESVQELLKTKSKIPTILEMTKMSTTILKSLSAIDRKERTLRSRMQQIGDSMSSLEKRMQTKDNNNKLDKHAFLQLSKHVKTLAEDMQRINKFVVKIDKNQPSAETMKKNEAVQGKLVSAVIKLRRKMADMDLQMKRYQNSAQRYAVKMAKTLISKSTSQWKTSLKELKSDLKELRQEDKSTKRKLDRLEETFVTTKAKIEPTLKCPMGTIRRGHMCFPAKFPGKKPPKVMKVTERKEKKKEIKGKEKHVKGTKGKKKHVKGTKGNKKHVKGTKGNKKHVKGTKGKKKHVKGKKKHVKGTKEKKKHVKETKGKKKHVKGTKGNKKHVKGTKGKKKHVKGTKGKKKHVKGTKGKKKHVKGTKGKKKHVKGTKGKKKHVKGTKGKKKHVKGTKGKKKHVKGTKGKKKHVKGTKGKEKQPKLKCPSGTRLRGNKCHPKTYSWKKHVKGTKGKEKHVKGTKGNKKQPKLKCPSGTRLIGNKCHPKTYSWKKHVKGTKGKEKHVKGKKGNKKHVKGMKGKEKQPKLKCPSGTRLRGNKCHPKTYSWKKHVKGTKEKEKQPKLKCPSGTRLRGNKCHPKTYSWKKNVKGTNGKEKQPKLKCPSGTRLRGNKCYPKTYSWKKHVKGTKGKEKQPKLKCPSGTRLRGNKCHPKTYSWKKHVKGTKGKEKHVKGTKGKEKHVKGTKGKKEHVKGTKGNKKHLKERKGKKRHFRARKAPGFIGGRERREVHGVDPRAVRIQRDSDPYTKHPVAKANKKGPFCPPGYQLVDVYCFMYLPEPQTYDMAKLQCQNHDAEVPEIYSNEMQLALKLFLLAVTRAEVPSVWLSAMIYNPDAKKWYWENSGDSVFYENYMTDPPAGREGEMCNQYRIEWDSHWSASPCNEDTKLPTVCHHHVDHIPPSTEKLPYGL